VEQPRAGYLDFNLSLKGDLQISWLLPKLSDHWMSTDGKADPNQQLFDSRCWPCHPCDLLLMMEKVYTYNATIK
jgi:hypothetical protein